MKRVVPGVLVALAGFAAAPAAHAEEAFGQILKTTRSTPVFRRPSARAKVLADADRGVTMIVRDFSPNGTWLYVEDEDRNRGWVPRNRTDYPRNPPNFLPPPSGVDAKGGPRLEGDRVLQEEREESAPMSRAPSVSHRIGARARRTSSGLGGIDPNGDSALGVSYAFLAPGWIPGTDGDGPRSSRVGFEFGYLAASGDATPGSHRAFSVPVRYRMLAKGYGSSVESGPDMGFVYFRRHDAASRWSFSAGWTLGWAPDGLPVFADLRLGVELLNGARLSGEFTLGLAL